MEMVNTSRGRRLKAVQLRKHFGISQKSRKIEEQFGGKSVPWLKEYLTKRWIQESDQGRSERKAEVVELV